MSRVFVPQVPHRRDRETGELVPQYDLSAAQEYGVVRVILSPGANPFSSSKSIIEELHEALKDINEQDWLLMIGNPTIICWTGAIASYYTEGKVKTLQWDGRNRVYNPIRADVN